MRAIELTDAEYVSGGELGGGYGPGGVPLLEVSDLSKCVSDMKDAFGYGGLLGSVGGFNGAGIGTLIAGAIVASNSSNCQPVVVGPPNACGDMTGSCVSGTITRFDDTNPYPYGPGQGSPMAGP